MKITFLNTNQQEMTFDNGTVTVGREEDNTIQLQSDGISRHHGKIYSDANGDWFVEDLGSTNGIRLNGKKITAAVKLAEDDVMDFHQDKLKISGIAALDTIAFTPVSTDTAKISVSAVVPFDETGSASFDPIIPSPSGDASSILIAPAAAEPEAQQPKGPELEQLAEFIQQNTNNLFNSSMKKDTGSANNPQKSKPKFGNKLFYVTLICAVIVIAAFLIKILEDKKAPLAKDTTAKTAKEYPLYLTYIKENITPNNVFRFMLVIEEDQASFSVDDLKSQLRYGPINITVPDSDITKLKQVITESKFMKLEPVSPGIFNNNEREFKELNIIHGPSNNHIILKNRPAPREFMDIEEAINVFAESCNMATFSLSPEELREQALVHFRTAEDKFANYETNLANLKEAINSYNIVIEYLSGMTPEPKIRRESATQMKRAKELRSRFIQQYRSQYVSMLNQRKLAEAKDALEKLLELYENNTKEYQLTKERMIKLDTIRRKLERKK